LDFEITRVREPIALELIRELI